VRHRSSEALRFFSVLFRMEGCFVELRALPAYRKASLRRSWVPVEMKQKLVEQAMKSKWTHNVFFGVCPRYQIGRGSRTDVSCLPALWADLDERSFEWGLAGAMDAIESCPVLPSVIVLSGHGYHVYYFLDAPLDLDGDPTFAEALLRALQEELGSDRVSDVARLLRVPGTLNLKDVDDPCQVSVEHLEERRYRVDELAEVLAWEKFQLRHVEPGRRSRLAEGTRDGLDEVLHSDFVEFCRTHASELPEPLWYAMITNLIPFRGGRGAIHELSRPHPTYSYVETEAKIAHALRDAPGPHTYRYIADHGFQSRDLEDSNLVAPASRGCHSEGPR